ncbi:DDE-domain-containing protein [Zopfia rhizophila CBS 207.26]|uniref:DDE-domain-containing protein n=1 Tax=Zopfia rhizophila CBS 207.26 TaxID=1314779 RepID=A0A6A6DL65_9PEZI|nr:DDE-domain-containing protein [Zopfia rhizophila CBS 207.26]
MALECREGKDRKNYTVATETNRDYLTSVEAISASGVVIPPLLILKAKQHLFQWYNHTFIPNDYILGVSGSGYNNDELTLDWIQHFDEHSAKTQVGAWRLLIFDGFGGHMTKQFLQYCDEHLIYPFPLPSHTSHLLQPLDLSAFQPFKYYHKRSVEMAVRTACVDFNKVEFLYDVQGITS